MVHSENAPFRREVDGYHVDAALLRQVRALLAVGLGGSGDAGALQWSERGGSAAHRVAAAGANLNKDQAHPLLGYYVNFSFPATEVVIDDAVAFSLEAGGRYPFAELTEAALLAAHGNASAGWHPKQARTGAKERRWMGLGPT